MVFGIKVRGSSILSAFPSAPRWLHRTQSHEERTQDNAFHSIPASPSVASNVAPLPTQSRCRQCNSPLLFRANAEKRTCTECGCLNYLSEEAINANEEEEEDEEDPEDDEVQEAEDVSDELGDPDEMQACLDACALAEEGLRRPPTGARRRPLRKEDVDYTELLAQLLQLSLTVCNADVLDCMAVVSNFAFPERVALRSISSKVCKELAVLFGEGDDPDAPRDTHASSSGSTRPARQVEPIVAAFLTERLQTDKFGKSWGKPRKNSTSSTARQRNSVASKDPRPPNPDSAALLSRSATYTSEISLTSFTEFARDHRTFTFDAAASPPDSPRSSRRSKRGSGASSSKSRVSKRGSAVSLSSGKTSMSRRRSLAQSQASSVVRSMLRRQADESQGENIGDLTWGMDGVPHDGGDQYTQQIQSLISRYGGERRAQRAGAAAKAIGPPSGDDAPEIPLNTGSLMTFVMKSKHVPPAEREIRTSGYEESVATSVLLDHALAGMDLNGASGRISRQHSKTLMRALSQESVRSSDFGDLPGDPYSALLPALTHELEHGGVADGLRQRRRQSGAACGDRDRLGLIKETSPGSSINAAEGGLDRDLIGLIKETSPGSSVRAAAGGLETNEEAASDCCGPAAEDAEGTEGAQLTAKERWLQRKEAKKKRMNESGRTTYGAIVRNGYEQFLAGPGGEERSAELFPARSLDVAVELLKGASPASGLSPDVGEQPSTASQTPSRSPSCAETPSKDEAKARWERRRAEKRAARMDSKKTTYGRLVRLEHEQLMSPEGASAAASTSAAKPAKGKQALPSVRPPRQNGAGRACLGSSTTSEDIPRATSDSNVDPGQDLPGVVPGAPRHGSGDIAGARNQAPVSQGGTSILKDKPARVVEAGVGRRPRAPTRSVEFNLKRNLVYDVQDTRG